MKIMLLNDDEVKQLWKGREEITFNECLSDGFNSLKMIKKGLVPTIGEWLKRNMRSIHTSELLEDSLSKSGYGELLRLTNKIIFLYTQLSGIINFRYTLKFYEKKVKYFKTNNVYWIIEKDRYEKLSNSFNKSKIYFI